MNVASRWACSTRWPACWGNRPSRWRRFEDLFGLLLRASDLGHIPQTLDAVTLVLIRLDDPDYVFVLGLAEGKFPTAPSITRCSALMANEIDLPTALRPGGARAGLFL